MRLSLFIISLFVSTSLMAESTCYGTTSAGRLENGCKLPSSGNNYQTYSSLLSAAGRTYVHCYDKEVIVSAYDSLEAVNGTRLLELQAAGIYIDHDNDPTTPDQLPNEAAHPFELTENGIREELGLPNRDVY